MEDQMLSVQKKMLRMARLSYITNIILVIALIAAAVILIPRMNSTNRRAGELMEHAEKTMTTIDKIAGDAQTLIKDADKMVTDNTDAVTQTVKKLNEVNFDTLNEAIENLNAAVKPLAEFAKMFQ